MLMNFEEEVGDVSVAISHPFQPFDFIVDSFRDSSCDPGPEKVQDQMPFAEKLLPKRYKSRDIGGHGSADPLPKVRPGGFMSAGPINFKELLLQQHGPIHPIVKFGQLFQHVTLPF